LERVTASELLEINQTKTKKMKTNTKNTAQFTPGPWQIVCDGSAIVGANGGTLVVETTRVFWGNLVAATAQGSTLAKKHLPEVDANARLIATAPELLEALLTALPYVEDVLDNPEQLACFKNGVVERDLAKIRAAIAKALNK
jgi:hypothetical protein